MSPSLEKLERLDTEIPEYSDQRHNPFCRGQTPKFYKEIADSAEGKTSRTHFFEKNLVGLYFAIGRPVPYAFRTKDGTIRSLDAGCVKFLCNRKKPELELIRDTEGFIVAVQPLQPLLARFEQIRDAAMKPYLSLARKFDLPFDIWGPVDERRKILSEQAIRDGKAAFRRDVLGVWGGRCAISGIGVSDVLQAAHIYRYMGPATNDLRNAILLRSDLHILFDAHLVSLEYVDGGSLVVRTSKRLRESPYAKYEGKAIKVPPTVGHQPAEEIIKWRLNEFLTAQAHAPQVQ